ncbi:HEXXH motif domain-containing protein [Streptomyces sp. NPDC006624]|uniref:HEXXH motif domain-containing protein n=1 Tax=Streptomyces sp. NPDC006624 TaxID=3154892 RepID=UPI0033A22FF1
MSGSFGTSGRPAEGLPRHGLPPRHFDTLAGGGGGSAVIAHLWDSERSHRLVLLGLLTATAGRRPDVLGPLSGTEEAWNLLVEAERHSGAVTDEILLLPETGRWLRHCLQRLQAPGRTHGAGEPPVWVDVGHLHLLAAAAAVRAGLPFELRVPARNGRVWLPTLGCATLHGDLAPWQSADVAFAGDTMTIALSGAPGHGHDPVRVEHPLRKPTPGWQVPRTLTLDLPDGPRAVALHELEHYRMRTGANGAPADAVSDDSIRRWTELLHSAWSLLKHVDPGGAEDVSACLRSIEPLPAARPFRWHSATMEDGMGGMAASEPSGAEPAAAAQFAAVLTHEAQHSKLSALLHMYSLHTPDVTHRFYAPWRDDPRPLRGMLHGVYAFTGVARFWRGHMLNGWAPEEQALAAFEYALRRGQLLRVLPTLLHDARLTALGRRMVGRLLETVADWQDESIRPDCLEAARAAVEDHWLSWRSHHLAPDPGLVADLARRWGMGPPDREAAWRCPEPRLLPDPAARHLDARAVLTRMRLDRTTAARLRTATSVGHLVLGARPADLHLLEGDLPAAERLYVAEIRAEGGAAPGPGTLWAGLARALRGRPGHEEAARVLTRYPELVRQVYGAVSAGSGTAPDPVAVADWLGRTLIAP